MMLRGDSTITGSDDIKTGSGGIKTGSKGVQSNKTYIKVFPFDEDRFIYKNTKMHIKSIGY